MDPESRKEIEEKASRAAYLIFRHINNLLTEPEDEELAAWISGNEQNWKLFEEFTGEKFKSKFFGSVPGLQNQQYPEKN